MSPVILEPLAGYGLPRNMIMRMTPVAVVVMIGALALPSSTLAQEAKCFFLCAPDVKIEPTFTFERIFRRPVVEKLSDGTLVATDQLARETVFELILAVGIPTTIPRIGFTFETIFIPFGDTNENPFTGSTASQLNRTSFRDNGIEVELELNLELINTDQTSGWLESHFDVVDKISPAARPGDTSVYTHKLNFELDTAVLVFNWLPEGTWLKNVELEGSLDYVATGLPKAGDVLGATEHFLNDDSPWSFSVVFVFPLAPLVP